jgi:predicted dehydrogenase/glycosyltransferase involved in cell wall biosynthesis
MYKVGLIGTGFIAAQKHLPALQRLRGLAEVVAVCDVNLAQAKGVATRFGVPKVFPDLQSMLASQPVDVVDICTPPRTHAKLAVEALRAGLHVLIEKPMAVSPEECDTIAAAAEQSGRKVCVAHSDLFYPAFTRVRKLVKQGAVGDFRGMRIFLSTPVNYMTSKPDHWAHGLPGGVIGESGPHVVYLTLAFINPIRDVHVHAQKLLLEYPWSRFEDYRLELAGEKGTSSVTLVYSTNQWAARVEVWGTRGLLSADLESQTLVRYKRSNLKYATVGFSALREAMHVSAGLFHTSKQILLGQFHSTHELLIRNFLESIRSGTPPPVTAQEGREAVRVMALIADQLQAQESTASLKSAEVVSAIRPQAQDSGLQHAPTTGGRVSEALASGRELRILKVCQSYYPYLSHGGFAVKVRGIAHSLSQRGHQVTVLTADLGPSDIEAAPVDREASAWGWRGSDDGVKALYLKTWLHYRRMTVNPSVLDFCRRRLKDFDVVHIYGLYDLLGPGVAHYCRRYQIPYVVEPMGMFRPIIRNILLKKAYHYFMGHKLVAAACKLIATSEMERQELVQGGAPADKIVIRRNGTNPPDWLPERGTFRREHGIAADTKLALFLGRLVSKKSPDMLLRAFAGCLRDQALQSAVLVLAGPDEGNGYRASLESLARQLGLGRQVLLPGPLYGDRKWAAYRDADVLVLPSQSENFGNVAAEAVACGTPVIVTNRCGVASLLDQRAALVVPYDESAVQAALTRMLQDDGLRETLRKGCMEVGPELSWEEPTTIMENLYGSIVRAGGVV